jgi:hypothetical protein
MGEARDKVAVDYQGEDLDIGFILNICWIFFPRSILTGSALKLKMRTAQS